MASIVQHATPQHTSGLPDLSKSTAFSDALVASLQVPPPPAQLLSDVANEPLLFEPGSEYHYSNSDNIAVALMVQAATGTTYEAALRQRVLGATTDAATRREQLRFVTGSSEPPGPGRNAAGLGVFRYTTRCGTVYGHTGNTAGYTQLIASTRDGKRSVSVSLNAQIIPTANPARFRELRNIFELAVCAALA